MTPEEKARAYDEAIAKAQKELQTCGSTDCDAARQIYRFFPELSESEDERIRKSIIAIINNYVDNSNTFKPKMIAWLEKQGESKYMPKYKIGDYVKNTNYKGEPIYEIIYMDKECYICEYRGKERMGDKAVMHFSFDNPYLRLVQKSDDKVEPKFKVKYAGNEYNVFETKDIAGVTFYGIEDEPNHIDYVKAENCEIISVYAIKENGSPYPTKPAVFSEKKPKRMISAEAKECIYGSDNEQVSSEKIGKNDTLLDLLHKMPSYIKMDGIFYHFMLRKTAISYMAFYGGEGEGSGKVIFCMAGDPVDILTEMLEKLKEEGLLE